MTLILEQLNKGQERSVKAKKNILGGILIRGMSIIISLVFVPLTIDYINPTRYGIWLTLSSIVGWFTFFDIGLSGGLRNKFAEAVAAGNDREARVYVSTIYAILGIIFLGVWLVFLVVNQFLDWATILNVSAEMRSEVSILALIVFTYFCLQFVLRVITTILTANQQPAKGSLIDMVGQAVSLLFVVILVQTTEGSLLKLGIALCLSPILVLLGANLFFFSREYKNYRPTFSLVDFSKAKDLFNLGLKFFVVKVAYIVQFQTANIIIAQHFGTVEVTSYNIVYKYFGILNMVFIIFLTPFWSASTEAYFNGDINWIKRAIKQYNLLNLLLFLGSIIMLVFSQRIYELWLGEGTVDINFMLSLWGFFFFNVTIFGLKYVNFLNGISALKIQFIASAFSPILFLVTAMLLIRYFNLGVYSLFVASVVANFNGYFLAPLQYYQIVHRNKKGIWIK
ncbi:MAG: MATE family efflux transporter [Lewinella sp.]|nr:MATE family efflux transporter [Lewinella sp.]